MFDSETLYIQLIHPIRPNRSCNIRDDSDLACSCHADATQVKRSYAQLM